MKQIGGLFERIANVENVSAAVWRASKGKRDREEVRSFLSHADSEIETITEELLSGQFEFSPYRCFRVKDTKTRTIHAPMFRDRVVHHAMIRVTGPVFEMGAMAHSYACRTGRGQHRCLKKLSSWIGRHDYFLKLDIEKYYDSISHRHLQASLNRRFSERLLKDLFAQLFASYSTTPGRGLPIGALTSQYLGNFYLDELDRFIKQELGIKRYLRYMDDMILLGEKSLLQKMLIGIKEHVGEMDLKIKDGGVLNSTTCGLPWLGMVIYPGRSRLNRGGRKRLRRKFRELESNYANGRMDPATRSAVGRSLFAHASCAGDIAWRRRLCKNYEFGDAQEPEPRHPRRLVEQHREEVPLGVSQQEEAHEPQQEPGFPACPGSRYGSDDGVSSQPEDVYSRALPHGGDEYPHKSNSGADRRIRSDSAKGPELAAPSSPEDAP